MINHLPHIAIALGLLFLIFRYGKQAAKKFHHKQQLRYRIADECPRFHN